MAMTIERTVPSRQPKHKRIASHAMDNAKERVAAYYAKHAEVIDEYLRLKEEVKAIAVSLGHLEHSLQVLVNDLGKVYEKESR